MLVIALRILFSVILITMIIVTSTAQMHENLFQIPPIITNDRWFIATMFDAYFGFLTFYVWAAYRCKSWFLRIIWFILIMALGNMAMALYMLILLFKLPKNADMKMILMRPQS